MTAPGNAALLVRAGVHQKSGLVHLGFVRIGVDVSPDAFHGLMEALVSFDLEVVQWVIAGRRPRAVVRPQDGFLVMWSAQAEQVYWEVSGFGLFLDTEAWGEVLQRLQRLQRATRVWRKDGTPVPDEFVLTEAEPLLVDEEYDAVDEAVRWLHLPPESRRPGA